MSVNSELPMSNAQLKSYGCQSCCLSELFTHTSPPDTSCCVLCLGAALKGLLRAQGKECFNPQHTGKLSPAVGAFQHSFPKAQQTLVHSLLSPSSLKLSFSTGTGICGLLCQFLQSKEYNFHKLTGLISNSIKMLRFAPKIKIGTLFFPSISQITAAAILIAVTS